MTATYCCHMNATRTGRPTFVIIPCGAEKADTATAARDLYTGAMFRRALQAAEAGSFINEDGDAPTVLILSALHGLLALDDVVAPYDVKMGDTGSVDAITVAAQAIGHGIAWGSDVFAMVPRAYFTVLDDALRVLDVYPADVYEADAGIGYQRGTLRCVVEHADVAA